MSIILYTGKPGAGKTYRVVKELLEDEGRYYVFHNIDGLKESMVEGGRYIQSWVGIEGFFTKRKQIEVCDWARKKYNRSVLVIVDECQMVMGDRNTEIKSWLSWHRHLGQDIKLVCQHFKMLNMDFYNLCDYEVRGKRGIITSQFIYQWGVNGETFKTDRLRMNKAVFAAYTSFIGKEVNKGRSKVLYYGIGACAMAVCMGWYVIAYGLPSTFAKADKSKGKKGGTVAQSNVAGVQGAPKKPPAVKDVVLEELKRLSFAGVMGGKVMMQNVDSLDLVPLSDVLEYKVVEVSGGSVLVMAKDRGLLRLKVRHGRYLTASKIKVEGTLATVPPDRARVQE